MAKVISQETYDGVIQENIVEFSMSVAEAREETIKQFEAQGINLANIIKDLSLNEDTGKPLIIESIEKLKAHRDGSAVLKDVSEFAEPLNSLIKECEKSVPHRVLASKNDCLRLLLDLTTAHENEADRLTLLVQANATLINKQPDIFDNNSLTMIHRLLQTKKDNPLVVKYCLKWLQRACLLHENNRQMIVNADTLPLVKPLLKTDMNGILREVCMLFRYLILDDDVRVEFGKAHEHARLIATECLEEITSLLEKFKSDLDLVADILLTIASLTVRNEYCTVVESAGGLKFVLEAMGEHPDSLKLISEGLKLCKALGGNDKVKVNIIQEGAAPLITLILSMHKANENIAKLALGCISTLTLRVAENSVAFFDAGAADVIVDTMKIHATSKTVQRNAAWSIRNMVSRSRDKCDLFLNAGAEDCLNKALQDHPSVGQDIKSALRDLNVKVQLAEEWKGKAEKAITKNF